MKELCEIIAGMPVQEYLEQSNITGPLEAHPDIEPSLHKGRTLLIKNPRIDKRTACFEDMII